MFQTTASPNLTRFVSERYETLRTQLSTRQHVIKLFFKMFKIIKTDLSNVAKSTLINIYNVCANTHRNNQNSFE